MTVMQRECKITSSTCRRHSK